MKEKMYVIRSINSINGTHGVIGVVSSLDEASIVKEKAKQINGYHVFIIHPVDFGMDDAIENVWRLEGSSTY